MSRTTSPSSPSFVPRRPASRRLRGPVVAVAALLAVGAAAPAFASGPRIVITEIMYNPASDEADGQTEWVEIANLGDAPVAIENWRLDDEDVRSADDWGPFSCTLAPGAVAVLVNAAAVDEAAFRAAWDAAPPGPAGEGAPAASVGGYLVLPVKWGGLANNPGPDNEVLRLLDGEGTVVCEVNLQNGTEGWPRLTIAGGPSVHLVDPASAVAASSGLPHALSDGRLWKASVAGESGAREVRRTDIFDGRDVGSPGRLPGAAPATADASDHGTTTSRPIAAGSTG